MTFSIRRVVVGTDRDGRPDIVSDGPVERTGQLASGTLLAEVWPDVGRDDFVPGPGQYAWRVTSRPPGPPESPADDERFDPDRPGRHRTPTLDLVQVVSGQVLLEVDGGKTSLSAGDCVVQRGTWHRWSVEGDEPVVFNAFMLTVAPGTSAGFAGARCGERGPRRVVTDDGGLIADGPPPLAQDTPNGATVVDLWETMGPFTDERQGGDPGPGQLQLAPLAGGVAWKQIVIPPDAAEAAGHLYSTDTLDLVRIDAGVVDLVHEGRDPLRLSAGDCVVHHPGEHAWRSVGDEALVMTVVLLGPTARSQAAA